MDYEIYQAEDGHRKQYLVFDTKKAPFAGCYVKTAKKYFKCGIGHLFVQPVWVNGKELYLENPHIKGFNKCYAFSYYSNRREI